LLGGKYWHERYNKPSQRPYNPEVFTAPGSVFVVEIIDLATAKNKLKNWRFCGLPQLDDVSTEWQKNPWIRENGFGEIGINLEQHTKLRPESQQWVSLEELTGGKI
ncbi:MAG: hypothetical protein D3923_14490, partial [Candidatus Electrothrix sp. AR3]|nr:hypothetical protein [Candidatus Electrothrix sp. AR3]